MRESKKIEITSMVQWKGENVRVPVFDRPSTQIWLEKRYSSRLLYIIIYNYKYMNDVSMMCISYLYTLIILHIWLIM